MAKRYVGEAQISIVHEDGGPIGFADYRVSVSLNGFKKGHPVGLRARLGVDIPPGVAADSPEGYDAAAKAAMGIVDPEARACFPVGFDVTRHKVHYVCR